MLEIQVKAVDPIERLAGKVALVTGGGRGIGAAIATELALQGASVVIGYNASHKEAEDLAAALRDKGLKAATIALNTGSSEQIRSGFTAIAAEWGGLDILINNAGISRVAHIEEMSEELLDDMLAVNVKGVFLAIKEALTYIRAGGRIINIGSISSDYMPYRGNSAYVMTKSAVAGLTRGLARELASRQITINNVQPGRVETELLRYTLGGEFERARSQTPLGRFGEASEVAHMVAFLCGEEAGYVTGANLRVDGGVSV
ncbi:SDR family oxidoreductase [Sphingobium sp. PNB]|uniref:SDR family NAD(P)-dependent oxidoreductase n=1 Tax=Sphingobium sp. PNB TaxID=863934 RepID=UPI001CA3D3C8|nr:SDR family oxidoreductase [Sphingobium sp. PNB]MCB4858441.1 SDR family oxidoreductase [Sphingobium sp. PNB]